MAVVINEFEVVGAPAPAAPDKAAAAAPGTSRQEPDALQVAALVRVAHERALRVRAH